MYVKHKPAISEKVKQFRKAVAKQRRHDTMEEWRATVFSSLMRKESAKTSPASRNEFGSKNAHPSMKIGWSLPRHVCDGPSVKIWAAITPSSVFTLLLLLDTAQYKKILQTKLLPAAKKYFPKGAEWTFEQDNAKFHVSDNIMKLLKDKVVNANSSDLKKYHREFLAHG